MSRLSLIVLGFGLLASGARAQEDAKKEAEKFQGEWQVVEAQEGGVAVEELKKLKFVFKGDKFTVQLDESRGGTFKLNAGADPKEIDFKLAEEDQTALGIYKFSGDQLILCVADEKTKDRPTEFKTRAGARIVYFVLTRAKP
jgi:uncharacterized protein (TIGR03067 family)